MRIAFAGTPAFAQHALQALHAHGHHVCLVLTQPDRAAGRGLRLQASEVKRYALEQHLPILQPHSLKLDGKYPEEALAAQEALLKAQPEVMVVAAYGLILPRWTLELPTWGCLNIHASLLPRWRGAAPIQRALQSGDTQSGVCIMQMQEGLDTGPILLQEAQAICDDDDAQSLLERLSAQGASLIVQALQDLPALTPQVQEDQGVCYAHKITKEEAHLSWHSEALVLARSIRAFNPAPGAQLPFLNTTLKVWSAVCVDDRPPSQAISSVLKADEEGIDVQCAKGVLRLRLVQLPNHKRMPVSEFLKGHRLEVGQCLQHLA